MSSDAHVRALQTAKAYFDRSTRCLTEEDATFAPVEGMFTAAQHVAHVAQTVDWFLEGVFGDEGFDLDFEKHEREVREVTSLAAARDWLDRAFAAAIEDLQGRSREEMDALLPEDSIMGPVPCHAMVPAIADHTAHHRGALTVYARLRGRMPAMPYMP